MNCDVNYLHRADGSCLYSQGNTTVVASIDGPGDLKSSRQSVDSAVVQVVVKRSIGGSSAANAQVAYIIENLCYSAIIVKLFPKTLISIVVQELETLLNSGLPMFDTFAAVTIAILPQSEEIIPSPSSQIEESAECLMTAVFLHHHAGDLYGCWSRGLFTGDRLKRCMEKAHSISKTVFASFRQTAASSVAGKLSTSALSPSSSSG
uniref:RNase_PH domain-containing protein n=1 Tax=Trichuris muris TaxID=70415 RepID=A0A5S6R1H2_TRIMR